MAKLLRKKTLGLLLFAALLLTSAVLVLFWSQRDRWEEQVSVISVTPAKRPQERLVVQTEQERDVDYGGRYVSQFEYVLPGRRRGRIRRRGRMMPPIPAATTPVTASLHKRFPRYFIIGFAKTGTKALYEVLKLHSQLSGPKREMRYFTNLYHWTNLTSYLTLFPPPPSDGYTIEKSPDYILSPDTAVRIREAASQVSLNASSDIKLIVMLRNPVERTVSDYLEMQIWSHLNRRPRLPSFENIVLSEGRVNGSVNLINSSCYSYHLKYWLQSYDLKQFCFVSGDDFIKDPYKEVKNLEKCLNLKPYFMESHFVFNRKKQFYCFRRTNTTRSACMNKTKGRTHPFVSESVINQLRDYFRPHNERLYSLINRSFDWESSMKY